MSQVRDNLKSWLGATVVAFFVAVFVACALCFCPCIAAPDPPKSPYDDHSVRVETVKVATPDGSQFKLFAFSELTPFSVVKFEVTGNNIKISPGTLAWRGLSRGLNDPVVVIDKLDTNLPFDYHYHYSAKIGGPSRALRTNYNYALPFGAGKTFKISESYGGWSHKPGGPSEFAVDFDMPTGTQICAARDGIVYGVRSDATVSGVKKEYENAGNYVVVRHADGTFAEYVHLVTDGVLVKPGASVAVGQPLGFAGATGFATGPHLHFCVFYFDEQMERHSMPVPFATSAGLMSRPELGRYVAR